MTLVHKSKKPLGYLAIATLLLLLLCGAGGWTGYGAGYQKGYTGGGIREHPFPRMYAVSDLVTPKNADQSMAIPDYDRLMDIITGSIAVENWADFGVGDKGSISVVQTNQTLVIRQTQDVHEQIEMLLREMREATEVDKHR